MYKNLLYFSHINSIGGIETFYWNLVQKYSDYDIAIVYRTGDADQINRLRDYVRVIEYKGQEFECDRAFFNYNIDIIDHVHAKEYCQILHGDYKALGVLPKSDKRITKYYGVSKIVCDSYEELTGIKPEVIYNPFVPRKPRKILNLISATRLTAEKGLNRMIRLIEILDENDIPFIWNIYTDAMTPIKHPNVYYRKPRLDILDYIADADYLVQLSDNEGYCYSVVESLSVGTPVIVTDCPVFKEIGVNKSNGFTLDFDMKKVPIEAIYKGLPEFTYKPKQDAWSKILVDGESQYKKDLQTMVEVTVTQEYFDLQLHKRMEVGEVARMNKVRAEYIEEMGFVRR